MAKYSYEKKKEVVKAYMRGEGGYKYLSKKYGIANESMVRKWVNAYKKFSDEGIIRSRQKKNYSFQLKLSVVESYLTTEVSYQELALSLGINNPPLIVKWVNDYRIAGPDALREKRKGRKPIVSKPKKNDKNDMEK